MGIVQNIVKFVAGGVTGAVVGAAAGLFLAPDSGTAMHQSFRDRLRRARLAGVEAKAAKQQELIRRFREEVSDQNALKEAESQAREELDEAVVALGLGLNAPGAIAAQELSGKK